MQSTQLNEPKRKTPGKLVNLQAPTANPSSLASSCAIDGLEAVPDIPIRCYPQVTLVDYNITAMLVSLSNNLSEGAEKKKHNAVLDHPNGRCLLQSRPCTSPAVDRCAQKEGFRLVMLEPLWLPCPCLEEDSVDEAP